MDEDVTEYKRRSYEYYKVFNMKIFMGFASRHKKIRPDRDNRACEVLRLSVETAIC